MLFLHDHLDRWKVAGLVVAVAGVVLVNLAGGHDGGGGGTGGAAVWVGSLLVFGAVCCEASYSLMGKG